MLNALIFCSLTPSMRLTARSRMVFFCVSLKQIALRSLGIRISSGWRCSSLKVGVRGEKGGVRGVVVILSHLISRLLHNGSFERLSVSIRSSLKISHYAMISFIKNS